MGISFLKFEFRRLIWLSRVDVLNIHNVLWNTTKEVEWWYHVSLLTNLTKESKITSKTLSILWRHSSPCGDGVWLMKFLTWYHTWKIKYQEGVFEMFLICLWRPKAGLTNYLLMTIKWINLPLTSLRNPKTLARCRLQTFEIYCKYEVQLFGSEVNQNYQ